MTTVFHAWLYGRFIEIQSNLRRKKLHKTNQGSNFLKALLATEIMKQPQSSLEEKVNPSIVKDNFSSRTAPYIFTSIASVLLDQSDETDCVFFRIEINKVLPAPIHSVS